MEYLVGLPAGLDHQAGPEFEWVIGGVAGGGPVEPGGIGEVAEVADLEQSIEPDPVLLLPPHRQAESGQDAAVEVAEDQVAGDANGHQARRRGLVMRFRLEDLREIGIIASSDTDRPREVRGRVSKDRLGEGGITVLKRGPS